MTGAYISSTRFSRWFHEIDTIFADVKNVINEKVDDYFNIIVRFKNNITAEIELGTYYLTPKRGWFIGGNKGSAMIDDFSGAGKIVRTKHLLKNVPGKITMTALDRQNQVFYEELPDVECSHRDYFVNFINAYYGKEELMVKNDQVRRILRFLDAVRRICQNK